MAVLRTYLQEFRGGVRPVGRLRAGRLWQVDAWRGVALLMMVVYHLMWNLQELGGYDIGVRSGFWRLFQGATAGLFTVLVGVSLTLSYDRARRAQPSGSLWPKYLLRGAAVFSWGMVITAITYAVFGPERMVRFGILHLIGLSIVLAYPLLRFKWLNLGLAAVIIAAGYALRAVRPNLPFLEWLAPTPGHGVDYQPLIPMFSRVLIGVFLGNLLLAARGERADRARPARPAPAAAEPVTRPLRWLGQNSLLLYLVHQPVLIAVLFAVGVAHW